MVNECSVTATLFFLPPLGARVVPDENLTVNCSNYVLSWAGHQFEYYGLDFSCNSSSISTVSNYLSYIMEYDLCMMSLQLCNCKHTLI